ncbi:MAG: hypothetical protein LBR06_07950 [Bacteroidales bacterium]|jgi:hypothetical protein|nr:hypothetical protein [Bacteroidales bacterium]
MNAHSSYNFEKQVIPAAYEAPAVEIIEVEVEKGFAQSDMQSGGTW